MSTNTSVGIESSSALVGDLLGQRSRILSWLDNLESVGSEANKRVVERVRSDYTQRLEGILDELGKHLEAIRSDLARRADELTAATRRFDEATEELEEARLRHMIGEISDEEWRERQPDLTDAVTEAEADREDAAAEVQRLDDLLRQIQADGEAAAAPKVSASAETPGRPGEIGEIEGGDEEIEDAAEDLAESVMDLDDAGAIDAPHEAAVADLAGELATSGEEESDLTILHAPDPLAFLSELPGSDDETTVEQPVQKIADLDFLRDLDRAISGEDGGSESPAPPPPVDEDPEQFRPRPGTKCPECGYTNDPEAWYCGVCGVDLA
jgi:hypothetical protein